MSADLKTSPLAEMHASAMKKILSDPTLRMWIFSFITEDCHVGSYEPVTNRLPEVSALQSLGNLLLRDMKAVSLKNTHKAEEEYLHLLEVNAAWHEGSAEPNPFGEDRIGNG